MVEIRGGVAGDAAGVAALHTASWRGAYAGIMPAAYLEGPLAGEHARLWEGRLAGGGREARLLVAVDGVGEPAGFVYLAAQGDGRVLLDNLHVRPGLIGTGLGRRLLRRGFGWAAERFPGRDVYLEVLDGNARAVAFYVRQGGRAGARRTERFPAGFEVAGTEFGWAAAEVARLAEAEKE